MKSFVVIGLGRFGSNLARTLYELGNEVLAIDENPVRVQDIANYVTQAVTSDCKDESILRGLGVRNFDCAVVAISDDVQASILITMMLKELGVKYVIGKSVSELHTRVLKKVGADKIVFPEKDMGMKMAQSLSSTNILDFIELSDDFSIVEINMPKEWVGKSLRQLNVRAKYGLNIVAIRNSDTDIIDVSPSPDYNFKGSEVLVVIGSNDDITRLPS